MSIGDSTSKTQDQKSRSEGLKLARKVIIQALQDFANGDTSDRLDSAKWFFSPAFSKLCKRALVDHDALLIAIHDMAFREPAQRLFLLRKIIRDHLAPS